MSRKIDVKLPHEMESSGDWRDRFDKPILHKEITPKEDKNMAVTKADKVANNGNEPVHGKLTKEEVDKCKTCERRNRIKPDECQVMKEQFEGCWAYTRDPYWNRKVRVAVARYGEGKNYNAS